MAITATRRRLARIAFVLCAMAPPQSAVAEIYKCQKPDGTVLLKNFKCTEPDITVSIDGRTPQEHERLLAEQRAREREAKQNNGNGANGIRVGNRTVVR